MKPKEIRKWMIDHDLNQYKVAKGAAVDQSSVSRLINGKRDCPKLRKYLVARGCPEKFLAAANEK